MKKTFATFGLAMITVFGATFAQAGILVSDSKEGTSTCTNGIIISDSPGIIVGDAPGIIVGDIAVWIGGIIVGDSKCEEPAKDMNGILVSD